MAFVCATAALTADITLFRVRDGQLELLLIERGHDPYLGCWALPGGFVDPGEDPQQAAHRELLEETRVQAQWLLPIGGYGDAGRDPRGRTVTLTYLTVMDDANATAGDDAAAAGWFDPRNPPPLAFDHDQMVKTALTRLAAAPADPNLLPRLLPARFSLNELTSRLRALTGGSWQDDELLARVDAMSLLRPLADGRFALSKQGLENLAGRALPF